MNRNIRSVSPGMPTHSKTTVHALVAFAVAVAVSLGSLFSAGHASAAPWPTDTSCGTDDFTKRGLYYTWSHHRDGQSWYRITENGYFEGGREGGKWGSLVEPSNEWSSANWTSC